MSDGQVLSLPMKQKMLDELGFSRGVVCDGFDVIPRFRVIVGEGDYRIMAPMHKDMAHRLERLSVVKTFLIWRGVDAFIHCGESIEPNAIFCSLITRTGVLTAYQKITRNKTKKPPAHVGFGEIKLVGEVDPLIVSLLPNPGETLSEEQTAEAEKQFGYGGAFEVEPVVH